ncbi:MAG: T9SS type A sorting domain-containing protein [Lentimicrobiaceae bacterium]|nr:T9SS type A sorting domain-containing protein [Lentimicrobiaceae bacterium]
MKNILRIPLVVLLGILLSIPGYADYYKGAVNKSEATIKATAAGCLPGAGFKYLEVNNVRTRINTGGDMWWDFEVAQYEIPKGSRKTSMFSAALWIGGIDVNDQLKLAALKFRQGPNAGSPGSGNDFWPGPITIDGTAAIGEETCAEYDKLFPITRTEIDQYLAWWDNKAAYPGYQIPQSILEWPAHGDITKKQSYYLAPFFDRDGNGDYDPELGDYPYYDISNELCHSSVQTKEGEEGIVKGGLLADQVIKGDATLWWVFNDKGNIHTETQGTPIGLEIRAQAFGFATNDEINNMTFYSYEIINRSTYRLTGTYFSQWVDTDLGFATDDYVGCDVDRGLGYSYNGKPKDGDGQFWAYGDQPPAIGVDFFQGPYMDPDGSDNPSFKGDGLLGPSFNGDCSIVGLNGSTMNMEYGNEGNIQSGNFIVRSEAINGVNFGNGIVDDERFGMRRFVYHNNSDAPGPYMQDPKYAPQYYNYLKGIWLDNTKMLYGGNGHVSTGAYGPECDFMFPGDTDVCDWGTGGLPPAGSKYWTEEAAQNKEGDRRFMQSAGPFVLEPGAVNYITVGIPWARAASGGPWASVKLLQVVDDKCQLLFDNCFAVVSGPNAPDLVLRELDKEIIFFIKNKKTNDAGNNFNESYKELDPAILAVANSTGYDFDPYYRFEGYQVFQLKDASVSVADIHDQKLARLVYQCDVKNGVKQLVNHNFDQALNANVPVEEVNGADLGVSHTFRLTEDAFTGQSLINHKQYYYLAIAYGQNEYMKYSADPGSQEEGIIGLGGQKKVYLAGRKNIKVYPGIPHKVVGTTAANADFGDGVEITRLQGQGNGGNVLELSDETVNEIMSKSPVDSLNQLGSADYPIAYHPKYKQGKGPIDIRIIDPLSVKDAEYVIAFDSLVPYYQLIGADSTINYKAHWRLIDQTNNVVYKSDTTISYKNEQLLTELGLAITIGQPLDPGPYKVGINADDAAIYEIITENNGVLTSDFTFADSSRIWITNVPDIDGVPSLNWIRSGVVTDIANPANNDYSMPAKPFDPNSNYEKVVSATWAPYIMTASSEQDAAYGPAFRNISKVASSFTDVASVDVVYTADKSKWTRCPVIEMCADRTLAEGGVDRFNIRAGQSVDKDGNPAPVGSGVSTNPEDPNYIAETGMGWFPGYAINLETGERLNMVFGENSWLVGENGRDMIFNPSSTFNTPSDLVLGGMHYVYVFAHTEGKSIAIANIPAYDAGKTLRNSIPVSLGGGTQRALVYSSAMWVSIPIKVAGQEWLSNDAKVSIRISKPYKRFYSSTHDSTMMANDNENRNYPMYAFSTKNVATTNNNIEKAKTELDLITVVPNPYYAYSTYETNQLDNRVKITNLPQKCTVTIYSTNGSVIRQFTKDEVGTSIEWDLKNYAGIPIAGGVYLIHVKADGVGEKIVKWFGSLRPIDLNAF